jgi:hypothetical protein
MYVVYCVLYVLYVLCVVHVLYVVNVVFVCMYVCTVCTICTMCILLQFGVQRLPLWRPHGTYGIRIGVVSVVSQYIVYNCVYYWDTLCLLL